MKDNKKSLSGIFLITAGVLFAVLGIIEICIFSLGLMTVLAAIDFIVAAVLIISAVRARRTEENSQYDEFEDTANDVSFGGYDDAVEFDESDDFDDFSDSGFDDEDITEMQYASDVPEQDDMAFRRARAAEASAEAKHAQDRASVKLESAERAYNEAVDIAGEMLIRQEEKLDCLDSFRIETDNLTDEESMARSRAQREYELAQRAALDADSAVKSAAREVSSAREELRRAQQAMRDARETELSLYND